MLTSARYLLTLLLFLWLGGPAWADTPPQPGVEAPAFTLPDADGLSRNLSEWRGKWLVLYFYPKDNTPGCTAEAINFRDAWPRFKQLNAEIVGVSLDSGISHRAFAQEQRLPFPLLADSDGVVARRYGALSSVPLFSFAKRYTFLIDPEGKVAKTYLQVDASRHAGEVLAALQELQKR